jgi:arylsulfatase A-like enzyme
MTTTIDRPQICTAIAAVTLLLCVCPLVDCRVTPELESANIILVSVDTLRADAIAPYGGLARTPVLARLAREGVVFESAFAPAPSTAASHATLFTGWEPLRHGIIQNTALLPS